MYCTRVHDIGAQRLQSALTCGTRTMGIRVPTAQPGVAIQQSSSAGARHPPWKVAEASPANITTRSWQLAAPFLTAPDTPLLLVGTQPPRTPLCASPEAPALGPAARGRRCRTTHKRLCTMASLRDLVTGSDSCSGGGQGGAGPSNALGSLVDGLLGGAKATEHAQEVSRRRWANSSHSHRLWLDAGGCGPRAPREQTWWHGDPPSRPSAPPPLPLCPPCVACHTQPALFHQQHKHIYTSKAPLSFTEPPH